MHPLHRVISCLFAACSASVASAQVALPGDSVAWRIGADRLIPRAARPATALIDFDPARLEALALNGGGIVLDFPLGRHRDADLELVPIEPFEPGAMVEVVRPGPKGKPLTALVPAAELLVGSAFLAGTVVDAPGSHVLLASSAAGLHGFVELDGHRYIVSSGPVGAGLPAASFDFTALPEGAIDMLPWSCDGLLVADGFAGAAFDGGVAGADPCRQVRIAYETDFEFAARFSFSESAATGYIATLASAMTTVFSRDVGARLSASFVRLWLEPGDPWTENSTSGQLVQFRSNWNTLMTTVPRDAAHFLSGRSLGGGVAYLPGLCSSFAYGLSANLNGSFPTPLVDNSTQNWDPFVVAHELGHNFGAPHTHDGSAYAPLIDGCGSSPQDCSGAPAGTIMSYCHLCAGGIGNIRLGFHPRSIDSISTFLSGVACDYTGSARAPVAVADAASAWSTLAKAVDVLANDDEFNCESFTIDSVQSPTPGGAVVSVAAGAGANGRDALVYTNPTSFSGVDTFTYTIRDASNQTATGTVRITVSPLRAAENPIGSVAGLEVAYYPLTSPSQLPNFLTLSPESTGVALTVDYAS
ncbi:MAG: M12 family metallo-peptidase [Planctomycetota bacterium]